MKLALVLIVALVVSIALIVFPDIADQALRIEAFGWVFETRQGAFIVALLVLLFALWLMRSVLGALFAGPGVLWNSLRMGSRKRREKKLQEALAQCLDQRGDAGARGFKRSRGVLPDWASDMLRTLATPAHRLPVPSEQSNPHALNTVLTARIATNPHASIRPEADIRKAHLEAWLAVHPGAPLAMSRMADVVEEAEDWPTCIKLLEAELKQGHRPAESLQPRLVRAYLALSQQEPDNAMQYLRKSYQLQPQNVDVLLTYGQQLIVADDSKTAQRLWSGHLERNSSDAVAQALLALQRHDAMRAYRKLEGKKDASLNHAQRWLRAELAHAATLDGLAFEHMQKLADETCSATAWHSLGVWYQAVAKHEQAAVCFQAACKNTTTTTAQDTLR